MVDLSAPGSTVVLATRNPGKVRELGGPLAAFGLAVVGLESFPQLSEVEETGTTFAENALLKARATAEATGLLAVADDSGLEVEALDGAPGVRSARYAEDMPDLPGQTRDERNVLKLLAALSAKPLSQRGARFRCVMAACRPDGRHILATGDWEGRILTQPRGRNGFGYDPIFFDPELGRSAAELPTEEKMRRSHRARALERLLALWPKLGKDHP